MTWLLKLFSLSLKLYPGQFRVRFGPEIEEIFHVGLLDARKEGGMVGYILHELVYLPASLVGVYMWSMSAGQNRQVAVSSLGGGGTSGINPQGEGWGASFMAGLPHLFIGIIIISTEIVYGIKWINQNVLSSLLLAIFFLMLLGVLIFNISKGWKSWATSWIVYMFVTVTTLLSVIANALPHSILKNDEWISEVQVILLPLILAYLLYKIACKDRLRGLLAAIPPMALSWLFFLESVPTLQKVLAWIWILLLAFIATVLMLRTRRFSTALMLAMAVPILGGIPFAYLGAYMAGIPFTYLGAYMAGTLPISEPGPNLGEVFRQYLPFMAMVLTLVLGPQLGAKLRTAGYQSAAAGGKIFYRLVLGGILLGLFYSRLRLETTLSDFTVRENIMEALLVSAIVLFLVGYALLIRATYKSKLPSSANSSLIKLAALFFSLMLLPVVITLAIPIMEGHSTMPWLLTAGEMAWVIASTWVVKD
jgi:hypothetical protein